MAADVSTTTKNRADPTRMITNATPPTYGGGNINKSVDPSSNTTGATLKRRASLLDVSGAGIN